MSVFIRHRWYWKYGEDSYSSWINGLIEMLNRIDESTRVSGRIYSGWGASDACSLSDAYLELMILRSQSEWKLPDNWRKILFSDLVGQSHRDSLVSDLERFLAAIDSDYKSEEWRAVEKKALLDNCRPSLLNVVSFLKEEGANEVASAPVDENKLKSMAASSSVDVFKEENRYFPLSVFGDVSTISEKRFGVERTVSINKYAKEKVANVGADVAINEGEWLQNCVKNHVVVQVFCDFLQSLQDRKIVKNFSEDQDAKVQLKRDINDLKVKGGEPVIFACGSSFLNRLLRGMYSPDGEVEIDRRDGYGESYIFHFHDTPVYRLPFSNDRFAILASRHMFAGAKFFKIEDDVYVDVQYVPDSDLVGTLQLKFWLDTEFLEDTVWEYEVEERDEV